MRLIKIIQNVTEKKVFEKFHTKSKTKVNLCHFIINIDWNWPLAKIKFLILTEFVSPALKMSLDVHPYKHYQTVTRLLTLIKSILSARCGPPYWDTLTVVRQGLLLSGGAWTNTEALCAAGPWSTHSPVQQNLGSEQEAWDMEDCTVLMEQAAPPQTETSALCDRRQSI